MRAHRRYATPSLRRRLANAQSAQQVGRKERFRWGEIECVGQDGRIRGRSIARARTTRSRAESAGVAARNPSRPALSPSASCSRRSGIVTETGSGESG